MGRAPPTLQPPAHLPRELIDLIITTYISLYDQDPVYQWMHLRHVTSFHKTQLEQRFRDFWIPHMTITVIPDLTISIMYKAAEVQKYSGLACFEIQQKGWDARQRDSAVARNWPDIIMKSTYPIGDEAARGKNLLIRLGEKVLCNGYDGGGIMSDMMVPGLSTNDDGTKLWFDWKAFFTSLFTEEALARRMRDGILEWFIPTIGETTPQTHRQTVLEFLTLRYQLQCRWMLMHYRNHVASTSPKTTSAASFVDTFVDPSYSHKSLSGSSPSALFANLNPIREESMVFHIPDWRSLSVREIARLRAVEVRDLQVLFVCDFLMNEKEKYWIRGLEGWEGKWDVDEQVLEEELRMSETKRWMMSGHTMIVSFA